jgi:hypothetical protein
VGRGFLTYGRRLLLVVVPCLALAPQAGAATPVKGARYDQATATRLRSFVVVNRAGTRLANYELGGALSCSDGRRRSVGLFARGERPTRVTPAGTFSYTSRPEAFVMAERLRTPIKGTARTSFRGGFTSADSATVSVTTRFRSKRLSCRGTNQLTLGRDGTAGAPFQGSRMATGTYRASGRGLRVTRLTTLAPGGLLRRFRITARVACRNGGSYPSAYRFDQLRLHPGDRSSLRGREPIRFRGAYRGHERFRMTIAFSHSAAGYRVSGTFAVRSRVTRRGRSYTTCASRRTFTGGFVSGPANLF